MHVNTYATEGDISMTLGQKICGFIEAYCSISEGAQVGQPMKLKLFHDAKAPLANGHKRDSLLMMSGEEFESNHGFIQWAFPTAEKSDHNFNAPVLDLDSAIWLAERNDVAEFLENMSVRFLEFLKWNNNWKSRYNHNHLRISRAIDSLRLLHSWELADWLYVQVKASQGNQWNRCLTLPYIGRQRHQRTMIALHAHSLGWIDCVQP
jgi:hypothetical protein